MPWKATGRPTVRQQRGRWVVRVDGIDTESGKARPRQLGTYSSQRAARDAAGKAIETGRQRIDRHTLGGLVDSWVDSRTDVGRNQRSSIDGQLATSTPALGRSPSSDATATTSPRG